MKHLTKIMFVFGDIREDEELITKWNEFVTEKVMKSKHWPVQFDTWDPEGVDWGYMSMSSPVRATDITDAGSINFVNKNGFTAGTTPRGRLRFEAVNPDSIPSEILSPHTT